MNNEYISKFHRVESVFSAALTLRMLQYEHDVDPKHKDVFVAVSKLLDVLAEKRMRLLAEEIKGIDNESPTPSDASSSSPAPSE